jgi:hypothetical protein
MTQAQDSGDLEDIRVHDLAGAATRLLERRLRRSPVGWR